VPDVFRGIRVGQPLYSVGLEAEGLIYAGVNLCPGALAIGRWRSSL
jgi:hypothetical protein